MPANTSPIFPLTPIVGIATLTAPTALTSRANITGTTGLVQLTATSTNGTKVDQITVEAKGTTVANTISVWVYNGTTSFLYYEIPVTAITPNTTTIQAFTSTVTFNNLVLPPTYQLYISSQVGTTSADFNIYAFGGQY
jgi:hypothetical protein